MRLRMRIFENGNEIWRKMDIGEEKEAVRQFCVQSLGRSVRTRFFFSLCSHKRPCYTFTARVFVHVLSSLVH